MDKDCSQNTSNTTKDRRAANTRAATEGALPRLSSLEREEAEDATHREEQGPISLSAWAGNGQYHPSDFCKALS